MTQENELYQISLKLLLKNSEGKYLVLRANPTGSFAGYYDLPGGRVNTDELQAGFPSIIAREVEEEVGKIKYDLIPRPVAIGRHAIQKNNNQKKKQPILYVFFEAEYLGGTIRISHEHTGFKWVSFDKIDPKKYFTSGILEGIENHPELNKFWKNGKSGKKTSVVAVSGGFDPIHIGHVRMLKEAKALGDELVVIVNNDNWLKKKKGYAFMPEKERLEIIRNIKWVDRAVLTSHKRDPKDMSVVAELIKIKPDIFANGGDRKKGNVPEADICRKLGIKMVYNIGHGGKVQSSSWLVGKLNSLKK
ncbi:MAG: adenylyltransferase/cytidyltransferase family protein [Acidobacteriaceae bacterium]